MSSECFGGTQAIHLVLELMNKPGKPPDSSHCSANEAQTVLQAVEPSSCRQRMWQARTGLVRYGSCAFGLISILPTFLPGACWNSRLAEHLNYAIDGSLVSEADVV